MAGVFNMFNSLKTLFFGPDDPEEEECNSDNEWIKETNQKVVKQVRYVTILQAKWNVRQKRRSSRWSSPSFISIYLYLLLFFRSRSFIRSLCINAKSFTIQCQTITLFFKGIVTVLFVISNKKTNNTTNIEILIQLTCFYLVYSRSKLKMKR